VCCFLKSQEERSKLTVHAAAEMHYTDMEMLLLNTLSAK